MTEIAQYKNKVLFCLVRGVGDVGSAIVCKLLQAGYSVVAHENRDPRTIRRRMAFCDVFSQGESFLEGVTAYHLERLEEIELSRDGLRVGVFDGAFDDLRAAIKPDIIIDSRIQKFTEVDPILGFAPLTIGVGPNFIAGKDVDFVIESCWGDELGRVIEEGSAIEPVPVPPRLNGAGWERFLRIDDTGLFQSDKEIGEYVKKDDVIGHLNGRNLLAPLSGYLRGLMPSGFHVTEGEKVCEIDPRETDHKCVGLAERPKAIGEGVLQAIDLYLQRLS